MNRLLACVAFLCLAAPVIAAPSTSQGKDGGTIYKDLAYVPGGDPAEVLDIDEPATKPQKPLPLVVYIHGGGWSGGSKAGNPAAAFTHNGFIAASVEYRFSQVAKFPAQIQDCQAAIRWLRANAATYSIDPDHIAVWGSSAGGHLVSLLGTSGGKDAFEKIGGNDKESDRVQAVVDEYGPSDFTTVVQQATDDPHVKNIFPFNHKGDPYSGLIGQSLDPNAAIVEQVSPIHYVSNDNPPFLILHGTYDALVPYQQSVTFADKLKIAKVPVVLQTIPGAGHGGKGFGTKPIRELMLKFLDHTLKGDGSLPEALPESDVKVDPPSTRGAK